MTPPPMPDAFVDAFAERYDYKPESYLRENAQARWDEFWELSPPLTPASLLALPGGVETARAIAGDAAAKAWQLCNEEHLSPIQIEKDIGICMFPLPRTTKRVYDHIVLRGFAIWWNGKGYRFSEGPVRESTTRFEADACAVCVMCLDAGERDSFYPQVLGLKQLPPREVPLDHWAEEVGE